MTVPAAPARINILLVDDEPMNLVALRALLDTPDRNLVTAQSGPEAMDRLKADDFALVLLDIQMPVMDGYEVARRCRELERHRQTPIVFLTALDRNMVHIARGYALGAVDFVFKPIAPDILKSKVAVFVELNRTSLQLKAQSAELDALRRRSDALKAGVLEAALDSILVVGHDGRIVDCNVAAEKSFGLSREEALHVSLLKLIGPGEAGDALRRDLAHVFAHGDGHLLGDRREAMGVRADGTPFPAELAITRVPLKTPSLYTVIVRDLTDRKRLEEQLVRSQKMEAVGRLAGGIAHDFNNLLTVIIGYSEMVLGALRPGAPLYEESEEIRHSAERAQALTRQLLAFSRRQVLSPQELDLTGVVVSLQRMLRRIIGEDVDLVTVLEPRLGIVRADHSQVEQVIANLVVNARDAMPSGGRLTVETANVDITLEQAAQIPEMRPGVYVLLKVSDTGTGMDPATQERIFEPYFTTKPVGKGSGLGLATTYGIVKQSGGHIGVTSFPGQGSAFAIYLPRIDAGSERILPAPGVAAAPHGTETVLVVDDDAAVRRLTRNVLRATGYQVLEAENADAALGHAVNHSGPIHVAIAELTLQDIDGRLLCSRIREARPDIRLLYVAGDVDAQVVAECSAETNAGFLAKPFSPSGLARKVRGLLDAPREPVATTDISPGKETGPSERGTQV